MLTSIRTALALMFAVLATVAGLEGAITYRELVQAERAMDSVVERQLLGIRAIHDIGEALLRVRSKQLRLVLAEAIPQVLKNNLDDLRVDLDALAAARRRYEPLIATDAERDIYQRAAASLDNYMRIAAPVPDLMSAGKVEAAQQLLLKPWMRVLYISADGQLQKANTLVEERARANSVASVAALSRAKAVALVSSLVAAFLAVCAILASYWRILKPLGDVTRALNRLAAGDIGADHIPSRRPDEIGAISRAVAAFRASLIRGRQAEADRVKTQAFVHKIAASTPDGIVAFDDRGIVTFWNDAAETLLGTSAAQMLGRSVEAVLGQGWVQGPSATIEAATPQGTIETEIIHADGSAIPVELSYSRWTQDERLMSCVILRDIRSRKRDEAVLNRLAHTDALTGLPNRVVLMARMASALAAGQPFSVLMLDLDHFKQVNDVFGHRTGDAIIQMTAQRLLACAGTADTVTRIGGDEFVVLLSGLADPIAAAGTADAVVRSLGEPFIVEGRDLHLGASVGMALSPSHGRDPEELLTCADLALYAAKAQGRHSHRLFTQDLRNAAMRDSLCRQELPRAMERGEFTLFYQPQVDLADGTLMGAEALIRWQHPDLGLLTPDKFIHVLESSHLAEDAGDWVIREACRQAADWRRLWPDFRMGVNLSGAHFRSGRLARTVKTILADYNLPASALEVEITEHAILRHDDKLILPLRELHELGVSIAFDDYGTGYASLSFLKRFPLSRLKIDRGFVRNMAESAEDRAIIQAILKLGSSLGLGVIAEGVETQAQADQLIRKGCMEAQGYLFGRPMPADAFMAAWVPRIAATRKRA